MARKNTLQEQSTLKYLYFLPITIWMSIFFAIPTAIIVYFSFLKKGAYGGIASYTTFTLRAYIDIFSSKDIFKIVLKTLNLSLIITIITILVAIPTAYFISRSKRKNMWLLLIVIPFWTNFLVRIFSIVALIGNNGILNKLLVKIFFLDKPLDLLYNRNAVIIISVYILLPYAILPLYTAIEKFDFSLIDAARDLGANNFIAHIKIFLPGIKNGIIIALVLTFVPAIGSYAVPDIVGGTDGIMLGNIIASRMFSLRDWPSASAISTLFILITSMFVWLGIKADKDGDE
ncbi:ABC transporter permease [Streptobacillus notomytis]|uniref:ABC transporter permease n=1 Tax=Streptobacillus notomytis TaxID=1712031 RepID=UPI00082BFFD6|nr:ABC transporter permease [Streptobacillus notomytis]